jgi:hypothetical protein
LFDGCQGWLDDDDDWYCLDTFYIHIFFRYSQPRKLIMSLFCHCENSESHFKEKGF